MKLYANNFSQNVKDLADALRGKNIKELDLGHCELNTQDAAKIIQDLPELESLKLYANNFSENVKDLADALRGKK